MPIKHHKPLGFWAPYEDSPTPSQICDPFTRPLLLSGLGNSHYKHRSRPGSLDLIRWESCLFQSPSLRRNGGGGHHRPLIYCDLNIYTVGLHDNGYFSVRSETQANYGPWKPHRQTVDSRPSVSWTNVPLSIYHRHANKFYYVTLSYLIIHKMKAATVVKTIQNGDYLYTSRV